MATPSEPKIQIQPWASLSSLTFYWAPPLSEGSAPVTNYIITCSSINYGVILNERTFNFTVPDLTNDNDYQFQLAAFNFYGRGPYATFNTGQPGILSESTICTGATADSSSSATVTWTYTQNPTECRAQYFIVSAVASTPALSTTQYVAYPDQREYHVSNLQEDQYTFLVNAVNTAGWSYPSSSEMIYVGPS
jgi:hypothetical protein